MRTHGTLTRWNDERGFGFITPARGTGDVFVHISAFPRDGVRPSLDELISFEVEAGTDGRQRAVRVMRPARRAARRTAVEGRPGRPHGRSLGGVFTLIAVIGIGAYGYSVYIKGTDPAQAVPSRQVERPSNFSCDGRTLCSQMTSCDEATYFARSCPDARMDGDRDGVPCESQWCN
jgi:cold shock CspA family protein